MSTFDTVLLLAGTLLLLGIASSKFAARLGMPVLVPTTATGQVRRLSDPR